jgi:D-alanyl-D-alanine carboxypeptidase/D-alanyl-D-alanine-endopeptidase (penicillin-binding protein 4)
MSPAQRRFRASLAVLVTTVVPAIGLTVAWRWADARATTPEAPDVARPVAVDRPSDPMRTGLLSYRRMPAPIATRAAARAYDDLRAPLVARLGTSSCGIVTVRDEHLLDEHLLTVNPDLVVPSATSQQLLVGAVALDVLGPDFRFRTEVRTAPIVDGVVQGDLHIVGGGDPTLVTSAYVSSLGAAAGASVGASMAATPTHPTLLDALADVVAAAGVVAVSGNVVGDGTRYDDEFTVPTWDPAVRVGRAGGYDALVVDDGRLEGGGVSLNPNQAAASRFNRLLAQRGISVAGRNRNGPAPTEGVVALGTVESAPLGELVADLFVTGDPTTAELLLKEIGVASAGVGSRQAGLDAVRATLTRWGVPLDGVVMEDGSGLSAADRVTCRALAAVASHAGASAPLTTALPPLPAAQPAGQALTRAQLTAVRAHDARRVDLRAVTGVVPVGAEHISFSLVLAEPGAHDDVAFGAVLDTLLGVLAGYPAGPDVDELAPR